MEGPPGLPYFLTKEVDCCKICRKKKKSQLKNLKSKNLIIRLKNFYGGEELREADVRRQSTWVLWKDYPIEEAQWVPAENFMKPTELQKYVEEDDPQEEKI